MNRTRLGILHPGNMGILVAATARHSGCDVYWASAGRSAATRTRAARYGLEDLETLDRMVAHCQVLVAVCPPHAAEAVAEAVMARGFAGLYVDANAIAPQRARHIDALVAAGGGQFVDGGIIGGPAWEPGRTWLYLSGREAARAAACFAAGPLETGLLGLEAGRASALKICYAAYTKGTTALLAAILATAEVLDVRRELEAQWSRGEADFARQTRERVRRVTAKAWRFSGEMEEIAATFAAAGLPAGFHLAAADVYARLADFKDAPEPPALAAVLQALRPGNA